VILQLVTLDTYQLYWFYKQWRAQRRALGIDIIPWARALFSVFFVGRLFKAIDRQARDEDYRPTWNPGVQAGIYIAVVIGSNLVGPFASRSLPGLFAVTVIRLTTVLPLIAAQKVANVASDDVDGRSNAGFDAGSVLVVLFCWAFWGLRFFLAALAEPVY